MQSPLRLTNILNLLYNSTTASPPQADTVSLETFFFKSQLLCYLVKNWQQKEHELGNIFFFHALLDSSLGDVMSPMEKCGSVYEQGSR